jgi:bifunctional non-homologous end joining protein LigD
VAVDSAVAKYYERAMPRLLAEIGGRPVYTAVSDPACPGGIDYVRHPAPGASHIRTIRVTNSKHQLAEFAVVDDPDGVFELLEQGAIEFHPWGSRADNIEFADRLVFDIDPAGDVSSFAEVKQAALDLRNYLATLDLQSFLKTSGRKGLHVVTPLNPAREWAAVRAFTRQVAEALEAKHPARYVSKAALKLRPGKIFIDYLRNGRGTSAACAYSLRIAPNWPAALPLAWDELISLASPAAFPAGKAIERLSRGYVDPWRGIGEVKQSFQ